MAILAGMLLPALSKARERAKMIDCLSRLKQVGLSIQQYADISDGYIMSGIDSSTSSTWSKQLYNLGLIPGDPETADPAKKRV